LGVVHINFKLIEISLKREGINDVTNIALVFDGKRVYHKIEK